MSDAFSPLNPAAYLSAVTSAAQENAKESDKKSKVEAAARKVSFADMVKRNREAEELVQAGFPEEILSMETEEAAIFLKDKMDSAGDMIVESFTAQSFASYRLAVNQFVKYIVKNNFNVKKQKRHGTSKRTGRRLDPYCQIQIINQKLDTLMADMLAAHMGKLKLLARVNEIQGLVVDLIAV